LWFSLPDFYYLLPIPLVTAAFFVLIWRDLQKGAEYRPFFLSVGIFLMGYIGWGISLWPWLVPFAVTFRQAAAAASSQSFLLAGTLVILPVIIAYVAWCYYVFRGKVSEEGYY
jgi:cytochrome d ubiquinol oxidase subunit II